MNSSFTSTRLHALACLAGLACAAVFAASAGAAADAPPAANPADDTPVPEQNVMSSIKQSFNQNFDRDVIRGHFDVGAAAATHRYYCLVDSKSGKREPNGVPGEPVRRSDGMTGIKASSVSVYSCASAERMGLLMTVDYPLSARLQGVGVPVASPSPAPVAAPQALPAASAPPPPTAALPPGAAAPSTADVAGVRLGMSLDATRAVLRSKSLANYFESEASSAAGGARFVNVIAAWTPAADRAAGGESYQVMFTPLAGQERVLGIVHSMIYPADNALPETALKAGLAAKYGGYTAAAPVPRSPTWLVQRDGSVQVGDGCNRRGLMTGWSEPSTLSSRPNLVLDTTAEEMDFQREHCGVAIVTEDHPAATLDPTRGSVVTKYTVTAYGTALAADAARQLRAAGANTSQVNASRPAGAVPNL